MAMLSNFHLFKPLLSISNSAIIPFGYKNNNTNKLLSISNNNNSYSSSVRNSLITSRRHVCKDSSSSPSAIPFRPKSETVLLGRFSSDGNPNFGNLNFTTLSTTATTDKGSSNCCWPIIQHNDYISLPFPKTDYWFHQIVGSCKGLVCLADASDKGNAVIWNPSTNDYKMLPKSSPIQRPRSVPCFGFDTSFPSFGFGFDHKSQDYKMVRCVTFKCVNEYGYLDHFEDHVEVYSLKTDSWREVNNHNISMCYLNSTTVDDGGRCYWITNRELILCFDFSTEEFLPPIPLPDGEKEACFLEILEFDRSVALLSRSKPGEYNVWVLKEDHSCWSHVLLISHSSSIIGPIRFMGNDKLFFEDKDCQLLVYDLVAQEMKGLGIYVDTENTMNILPYNVAAPPPPLNGKSSSAAAH